jgi:hypothetical protein
VRLLGLLAVGRCCLSVYGLIVKCTGHVAPLLMFVANKQAICVFAFAEGI